MKLLPLLVLFILVSCSHHRGPASSTTDQKAYDSAAMGSVRAEVTKRYSDHEVCFDVQIFMKNTTAEEANAANWTAAWVDDKNQYHPVALSQRGPASGPQGGDMIAPYGHYLEHSNSFTTCTSQNYSNEIKSFIMTPKNSRYEMKDGLKFQWQ